MINRYKSKGILDLRRIRADGFRRYSLTNKTPYFHKPIHTASTRKREIERVLRLIQVVKCVRELKRETVRELFFFFF